MTPLDFIDRAALLYFSLLAAAEWSGFYFSLGADPRRARP